MATNPAETTLIVGATGFQHPTLDFFYRYWDQKRGLRALPGRSDIITSELRPHLGWVMLVDVASDLSQFRFRLVGTLVTQYFLKEGTGKTVEEVFADRDPSVAKTISALFRRSAREQAVLHTFGSALWLGPGFEEFEAIYLPLSDDGASVNMILHAFVFDRERVMMAREIARSNGGQLPAVPPKKQAVS
jgi:hypothetical protein